MSSEFFYLIFERSGSSSLIPIRLLLTRKVHLLCRTIFSLPQNSRGLSTIGYFWYHWREHTSLADIAVLAALTATLT